MDEKKTKEVKNNIWKGGNFQRVNTKKNVKSFVRKLKLRKI